MKRCLDERFFRFEKREKQCKTGGFLSNMFSLVIIFVFSLKTFFCCLLKCPKISKNNDSDGWYLVRFFFQNYHIH